MECSPFPSNPQNPPNSVPSPRRRNLVVQWNNRGFRSNFEELKLLLNQLQLAVVAIQECRLGEEHTPIVKLSLAELFEQLPKPFLVLGDFNAYSPAWGRLPVLKEFMVENDLIIQNYGEQTFVYLAYHLTSAIDLAVASPSIAAECSWAAHNDLFSSDHFPIFLTLMSNFNDNLNTISFNFQKADWDHFGDLCRLSLRDSVANIKQFTSKLFNAARSSVPFHKGTKYKT
ncbi:RNA-directed DNA polymerase from mobile element jockey [Plakobranchus ocellatus]|uniref:RNA-directed DNA polymerase from mobile element jockey n=1 Tax=Plakobranchus ocellatus TaxID=259542 RepID=A0AAV4CCR3_9GAST|nr:RNA-directed DNA polymerase from mobile element jockey [Plakobranchus ocellatus]